MKQQTRISVDLDREAQRRLKRLAVDEDLSLSAVIRALVDDLNERDAADLHRRQVLEKARRRS